MLFLAKYGAIPIVKPWVNSWTKDSVIEDKSDEFQFAWIFGDSELCRKDLTVIAQSWSIDQGGKLHQEHLCACWKDDGCHAGASCSGSPEHSLDWDFVDGKSLTKAGALNAIAKTRKGLVDAELMPYLRLLNQLQDKEHTVGVPDGCIAHLLGTVILGFNRSGLGKVDRLMAASNSYRGSVHDLR
ncbi:hypothetical protein CPLU01_04904 [Colletotrichum plurivorum]|uniref:Uncharacterized protein n=1 Tax=Colletotrichum plurivorum TaxID=2175906 RepID=A0A8H6NIB1_9PEZI|nr:hypothetical protein CPLU01_04904 [Colletotrichum plurivorum]